MSLSERVERLRKRSLEAVPTLSDERAVLITDFYRTDHSGLSAPVRRAMAFRHLMEQKRIFIDPGELVVGERGPQPKATPTYPEVCCHSTEDLDILDSREKVSFQVTGEVRRLYEEDLIGFWEGRSLRGLIFSEMEEVWKQAYEAGVFTEFMEQRAPGHTVLDGKIYRLGFEDLKARIQERIDSLDLLEDPDAWKKREQLRAMAISADALIAYAGRYAKLAEEQAADEPDPDRKRELERIAAVCRRVPARPPRDFWEAIQYYWFVHVGVVTELNTWDSFSPGHLDQHLEPFYRKGREDGSLDPDLARELLQCLWIKFNNQPAPPKVGVTAEESNTYTDFAQVNLGGITPEGEDAVSEVTYLILDVIEEMRLVQPSATVQVSRKNPDRFLKRAGEIVATGFGQPSVFNADLIVQELQRQGKSLRDAREGGSSGCVEVGAFGKENYNLTGYFNLPKVLQITLHDGLDPRTGHRIGIRTGDPASWDSFEELLEAFRRQVRHFVDLKVRGNNIIERLWAHHIPTPFLSLLIDDCIDSGRDYHDGGARYNTSYIQGVGLGTLTDCFTALKLHVFEEGHIGMSELLEVLDADFEMRGEVRRLLGDQTPRYGNDEAYPDAVMRELFEVYFDAVEGRPNTKGGEYHINLLPTTCHIYFGAVCGATPDGRRAGQPLSDGISPVQGADRNGPTAVFNSAAKMDHVRTGGTLLNMKLTPALMQSDHDLDNWVHLVRSYFLMDGHHVQFNVVDADTLRAAQEDPEAYRDLVVRVAGYSDYFCDLGKDLQDEIIARTEHRGS